MKLEISMGLEIIGPKMDKQPSKLETEILAYLRQRKAFKRPIDEVDRLPSTCDIGNACVLEAFGTRRKNSSNPGTLAAGAMLRLMERAGKVKRYIGYNRTHWSLTVSK